MNQILAQINHDIQEYYGKGKVAEYIPALKLVNPKQFAMVISTIDGFTYKIGDCDRLFSIQSISKLFSLTLALNQIGDKIWEHVGREPSGNPFNSLVQLEYEQGIPRNPFINAGAMVILDLLQSEYPDPFTELLTLIRGLSKNTNIDFDQHIYQSEKAHGFRNMALIQFMKSFNTIKNDCTQVLDHYFKQCSILMNCEDLARAGIYLANHGKCSDGNEFVSKRQCKRLNAMMLTCGTYDSVGDFAYRVGLPAKSGVGGAILAVLPNEFSVAVWSPELDKHGNSLIGSKALELLTSYLGKSIF